MSKAAISTSLESARRLTVTKQRLAGELPARPTREDIVSVVRDLAYVQWDPISVVAPSHIISLRSRLGSFRLADLDRLLWDDKKLFEHWTPIASLVLTEDYPIYYSLMRRYPESLSGSWKSHAVSAKKFLSAHEGLRKKMLTQLKKGPLQLGQFEDHNPKKSQDGWTPGSDTTRMLHHLHMSGEVMVVGHQGNQNIWGLSDEFLPVWVQKKQLNEEEFEREAALRAIRALGTATAKEINYYFPRGRYRTLKKTLAQLEKESEILRVNIEELGGGEERYIHRQDLPLLESMNKVWEPRMTVIAPFDNLISDRGRTNRLFGFDYLHEQFLPEKKRKFGTFVYPMLWGERLIGRVDLRMDKQNQKLNVISIHAEPGAPEGKEVSSKIAETLEQLGEFLGAEEVGYPARIPSAWRSALN